MCTCEVCIYTYCFSDRPPCVECVFCWCRDGSLQWSLLVTNFAASLGWSQAGNPAITNIECCNWYIPTEDILFSAKLFFKIQPSVWISWDSFFILITKTSINGYAWPGGGCSWSLLCREYMQQLVCQLSFN